MYRRPIVWVNKDQQCGDLCVETVDSCVRGILDLPLRCVCVSVCMHQQECIFFILIFYSNLSNGVIELIVIIILNIKSINSLPQV